MKPSKKVSTSRAVRKNLFCLPEVAARRWSRVMARVLLLIAVSSAFVIILGVRCVGENISSLPNERSLGYVPKKSESDKGEATNDDRRLRMS